MRKTYFEQIPVEEALKSVKENTKEESVPAIPSVPVQGVQKEVSYRSAMLP